jgi:hypothetical protein
LRVQWDQVGLVLVDALVVGHVKRPGFLWRQSEVGKSAGRSASFWGAGPDGQGRTGGWRRDTWRGKV